MTRANEPPEQLTAQRQWILWRRINRDGKIAKVPIDIHGKAGAQTHPLRWASYTEACEALPRLKAAGLGFAFNPDTRILGVDLDDCIDEGAITPWADAIVARLNSYTELSPSGTGLHIYLQGALPGTHNRKGDLEIYADGRFFTVTGQHWPGTPLSVEWRQEELNALYAEYWPPEEEQPTVRATGGQPLDMSDAELLSHAFNAKGGDKLRRLWNGDTSAYGGDDSRADLALVNLLAFWTAGDEGRIDRLFRQSALYRQKWERPDYRARTFNAAMRGRTDFYRPENEEAAKPELVLQTEPESKKKGRASSGPAQTEWMLQRLLSEAEGELRLYYTPDNVSYIRLQHDDLYMTWPVRSTPFRQFLRKRMFELKARAFRDEDLKRVVDTLDAHAVYAGTQEDAYLRVAPGPEGEIYLDLRNENWDVARITTEGWEIIHNPPALFRRGRNSTPLPMPARDGNLDCLREFLNVDDEQWILFASVLVAYINPCGPYPVLSISGEQGSGKSTACRIIKRLIDPAAAELYSMPESKRDVLVAAQNNWILAYENLSTIPPWLSDVFCVLATGGGFSARELYTDMEERVMYAQRPVVTNGIPDLVTRPDLLSRAIPLTLAPIKRYRTERQFNAALDQVLPAALGALLDAASAALRNVEDTDHDTRARMADFARWAAAAAPALGWDSYQFLDTYASNRETAEETVLETSPIAAALTAFASARSLYADPWVGTANELYDKITPNPAPKDWPKNARALSSAIRRYAPVLRGHGIDIQFQRSGHKGAREIVIGSADANLLDFASAEDEFASAHEDLRQQNEHALTQMTQMTQKSTSSPDSKTTVDVKKYTYKENSIDMDTEKDSISKKPGNFASAASAEDCEGLDDDCEVFEDQ